MLSQFTAQKDQAQNASNPHFALQTAMFEYADQVYSKKPTDVNHTIQTHPDLIKWKNKHLSGSQIWEGEKLKGKAPQIFTYPIVACAVVGDSIRKTAYGEMFSRVSIQPSWTTGNLVIVKEETHVDEHERKVIFLGRPVDIAEAKAHLIPAILNDIAAGSEKAKKLIPESHLQEAKLYLESHFESLFCKEQPSLFHVQHGIIGTEDKPFETWDLVRLTQSNPSEAKVYEQLRDKINTFISTKLYNETFNHLKITREHRYKC